MSLRAGENPFRTERLEQLRFRLPAEVSWEGLVFRLQQLRFRAAIVGVHGSGKTAFLDAFSPWLKAEGFRLRRAKLDEETRWMSRSAARDLFAGLGRNDLVVLDGAEQLNPFRWRWFCWRARRAAGLLVTTHRGGRLPTLIELRPTTGLLEELIGELTWQNTRAFTLDPARLFTEHAGNLRHALLACYDHCAGI